MTGDRRDLVQRPSHEPADPRPTLLGALPAVLTKAGREAIAERNRVQRGGELNVEATRLTRNTIDDLDDQRDGTAIMDAVVNDAKSQAAQLRSIAVADYVRRTTR